MSEVPDEQPAVEEPAFPAVLPPEPAPEPTEEEIAAAERRELSQRALQHRAELFVEMSKTDAFAQLLRELDGKKKRMEADFAARLRVGDLVDQRQVDYDRGFMDSLDYVPRIIEGAENLLKKLDAAAERELESQSEPDDEGDLWNAP